MSSVPSSSKRSRIKSNRRVIRQIVAPSSEYVPTVTPYATLCCGIPVATCVATIIASVLYGLSLILILTVDCQFTRQVTYFFSFVSLGLIATVAMAGINIALPRYHINCTTLSASLVYSGTAALVLFGLVYTSIEGLCPKPGGGGTIWVATTTQRPLNITTTTEKPDLYKSYSTEILDFSRVGVWSSGYLANYFIWCLAGMGLCFQVVAHYYYG